MVVGQRRSRSPSSASARQSRNRMRYAAVSAAGTATAKVASPPSPVRKPDEKFMAPCRWISWSTTICGVTQQVTPGLR
eukprot:7167141-Pyramimonas_sp.AAC.1